MESWNEIRTAACVARLKTISAAARELGIHRATVNRHLDALEAELGAKLFMRHKRGYTPTALGIALLRIADATSDQFGELVRMATAEATELIGSFKVTLVDDLVPVVLPILREFTDRNPKLDLKLIGSDRIFKLEYGEADVAFRVGPKPEHPDYVVLPAGRVEMGFFGPEDFDMPSNLSDLVDRSVVGPGEEAPNATYFEWLTKEIPRRAIGLRSNRLPILWDAVRQEYGIGFLPRHRANGCRLKELVKAKEDWHEQVWMVTHVDMHRSSKIQAFVQVAKDLAG
ncbi:MAG: LysR family transcriptional regulator [Sneathiellales bacterium]|nr:LysR family transcriptional regulator [Sneathiellales bacterium]